MKYLLLFIFFFLPNLSLARNQIFDEFAINDNIISESHAVTLKYLNALSEIENDDMVPPDQAEFRSEEMALGVEYNFSDSIQFRFWLSSINSFSNGEGDRIVNDPYFSVWKRVTSPDKKGEITRDFGLEVSPSIGPRNLYKSKNGSQMTIKYRFGLNHGAGRIHTTYLLGFKEGVKFNQNGSDRKYGSIAFMGISLAGGYKLYKKLSGFALLSAIRKSENQATSFYPGSQLGPSWETSYGLGLNLEVTQNLEATIGYRFKNESSAFNKFGNNLDIEDEQKNYFLSLSHAF